MEIRITPPAEILEASRALQAANRRWLEDRQADRWAERDAARLVRQGLGSVTSPISRAAGRRDPWRGAVPEFEEERRVFGRRRGGWSFLIVPDAEFVTYSVTPGIAADIILSVDNFFYSRILASAPVKVKGMQNTNCLALEANLPTSEINSELFDVIFLLGGFGIDFFKQSVKPIFTGSSYVTNVTKRTYPFGDYYLSYMSICFTVCNDDRPFTNEIYSPTFSVFLPTSFTPSPTFFIKPKKVAWTIEYMVNVPEYVVFNAGSGFKRTRWQFEIEFLSLLYSANEENPSINRFFMIIDPKEIFKEGGLLLDRIAYGVYCKVFVSDIIPDRTMGAYTDIPLNTFFHVAMCIDNNEARLYVEGQKIGSVLNGSILYEKIRIVSTSPALHVTLNANSGGFEEVFRGPMEVKGIRSTPRALYADNFTPPTSITTLA